MLRQLITFAALAVVTPEIALAYAGPGLGLGVVVSVLGVVAAFFIALIALIWFPVKRMLFRRKVAPDDGKTSAQ